jgi:predicted transcriptional regulator
MVNKVRVRDWEDVRAEMIERGNISATDIAKVERELLDEVRAQRLADLRMNQGMTQQALADAMSATQPRVSQIESGDLAHSEVGTIRAYVEALGGHLRMVADFGDQLIAIE